MSCVYILIVCDVINGSPKSLCLRNGDSNFFHPNSKRCSRSKKIFLTLKNVKFIFFSKNLQLLQFIIPAKVNLSYGISSKDMEGREFEYVHINIKPKPNFYIEKKIKKLIFQTIYIQSFILTQN